MPDYVDCEVPIDFWDYDWTEALCVAQTGEDSCNWGIGWDEDTEALKGQFPNYVSESDVKWIHSADAGQNDDESWIGLFELYDGRFMVLDAWCDYTGWD